MAFNRLLFTLSTTTLLAACAMQRADVTGPTEMTNGESAIGTSEAALPAPPVAATKPYTVTAPHGAARPANGVRFTSRRSPSRQPDVYADIGSAASAWA